MPEYARVENGVVKELRQLDTIPEHKAYLWTSVEGSGPIVTVDGSRVVRSPRPITVDDVAAERERRLALGFDYDFQDGRGVHHIGTTKRDLEGWSEVSTYVGALIDSGNLTQQIAIATDTGTCTVTPPEWRAIEIASAAFRQPLWAKSFALMASNPIPADYANDQHWT